MKHCSVCNIELPGSGVDFCKSHWPWLGLDQMVQLYKDLERARAMAGVWKHATKRYRGAFSLSREFADSWYQAYRRAMKLDPPPRVIGARPLMGAIYDFGRFIKRAFLGE